MDLSSVEARWRPADVSGPTCNYTLRGKTCTRSAAHHCIPRADKVIYAFSELFLHTKGPYARQPFVPVPYQEFEILRPLFGEVRWDAELGRYVRRYRLGYIITARKSGKSELAAAILLYLLLCDDEDSAEVLSAAKDTKQAGMVFAPALRMVQLNPVLSKMVTYNKNQRRLSVEKTASFYEVITADAAGELGRGPHGFNLDEVLSQPDDRLWQAITSAVGTRSQELLFATTTETDRPTSFGSEMIDQAERIQEDPSISPHSFVFCRKHPTTDEQLERLTRLFPGHPDLPVDTDPWNEANWRWSNPALDLFKSREAMRRAAIESHGNPRNESVFLQYQLNCRVQTSFHFIPAELWSDNIGTIALNPAHAEQLADQEKGRFYAGLDLSSKLDMTAWVLVSDTGLCLFRCWIPESVVPELDAATGGVFGAWVKQGWVFATPGNVIDYDSVIAQITADCERYAVDTAIMDKWSGESVRQRVEAATGLQILESGTTFQSMTGPMNELQRMLRAGELAHLGNPVAQWAASNLAAKHPTDDPDRVRPVKPDRAGAVRIDPIVAMIFAIDAKMIDEAQPTSAYEGDHVAVNSLYS